MIGIAGAGRAKRLAEMLVVAGLFEREPNGYRIHDYLEYNNTKGEALDRQDAGMAQRRKAGIASGASRRRRRETDQGTNGNTEQNERPVRTEPERPVQRESERPLNPIPSHPIPSQLKKDLKCAPSLGAPADLSDLSERAGRLLEHYADWYSKYRHGAKTMLLNNSVQFSEALALVRLWDDVRLEQLAKLILITDDDFVVGTDRGFHIFAIKASWADDRLTAIEQGAKARG